jgi:hypothetical protein
MQLAWFHGETKAKAAFTALGISTGRDRLRPPCSAATRRVPWPQAIAFYSHGPCGPRTTGGLLAFCSVHPGWSCLTPANPEW